MNIVFNDYINNDTLNSFVDKVNSVNGKGITMYLSSLGGDCNVMPVIRDIIEENNIHLVAYGQVASSALDLFMTTNTSRTILNESYAMCHKTKIDTTVDLNMQTNFNKYLMPILSKEVEDRELVYRFFDITDNEIDSINKGIDVYFDNSRFRDALKKSLKFFENSLVVNKK